MTRPRDRCMPPHGGHPERSARVSPAQRLYLDAFYREVTGFALGFVAVHVEICLSAAERRDAFDVFFDGSVVPLAKSVAALTSVLAATNVTAAGKARVDADDAAVTVGHCLRLLEAIIESGGLRVIVANLLDQEVRRKDSEHCSVLTRRLKPFMASVDASRGVYNLAGSVFISRGAATGVQQPDARLSSRVSTRYDLRFVL